jgi:hypothetical protein
LNSRERPVPAGRFRVLGSVPEPSQLPSHVDLRDLQDMSRTRIVIKSVIVAVLLAIGAFLWLRPFETPGWPVAGSTKSLASAAMSSG